MFDDLKKSLLCLVGGKSLTMRKYLDKPDLAQDSGTHEGAIKAARTRKLHGGMNYYIDDEIIDNGHDSGFAGDDDHNTEDRGHIKRWLWGPRWRKTWKDVPENLHPVSELLSKRQFPIGVRDDFLNFARGYSGNAEDVKTPIELSSKGYRVAHGKRRGELKLIKIDDLGGIDMKYSWRPKNPNKLRTSSVRRSSIPRFVSHSDEDLAERKRIGLVDKTMPTEEQISAMPKAARTAWENERKYAKVPYINYGRMPGMANTGIEPEDEERYHLYRRQEDSACDSSPNAFERYMTKAKDSGANDRETNCVIPIFNSKTMRKYLGEATDDWDESKHPRGNENNAGQFAKKGEHENSAQQVDGLLKTKIVDGNGNPKTLYHGTGERFERFDPGKIGERASWNGSGFYFSDSDADAKMYGPEVMKVHLDIRKPFDAENYDTLPLPMDRFGLQGRTLPDVEKEVSDIAKTVELAKSDEGNGFVSVFSSTDGGNNWEHLTRGGVNFIGSDESLKDRVARKVFSERHGVDYYSKPLLRDFRPTSITKTLQENGYDGVVAESSNVPGAKEYIAFSPDQIHILK